MSKPAESILGIAQDDLVGLDITSIIDTRDHGEFMQAIHRGMWGVYASVVGFARTAIYRYSTILTLAVIALPTGILTVRFRHAKLDGSIRWMEVVGHPEFEPESLKRFNEKREAAAAARAAAESGDPILPPLDSKPCPWPRILRVIGSLRDVTAEQEARELAVREREGKGVAEASMIAAEKAMSYACHGMCACAVCVSGSLNFFCHPLPMRVLCRAAQSVA